MRYGLLILLVSLLVGTGSFVLIPRQKVYVADLPALTYDTPIKVLTKQVRAGESFTTESTRCNNTERDLAIEITVWYQEQNTGHLIPVVINGQGPRFATTVPPGCRKNYQSTSVFQPGVPPGTYDFRGQICFGGVAFDQQSTCTGWRTESFDVLP